MSLVSEAVECDMVLKTGFLLDSVRSAIDIVSTIYKRFLAESSTIYSHMKSLKSPYCGEKVLDLLIIHDLSVNNAKSNKIPCNICTRLVPKERMRQHIGKHVAKEDIVPNHKVCGFCGYLSCSLELLKSGVGQSAIYYGFSDCKYYIKFSLGAAKKSTTYSPCTNRPVHCTICKCVVWSYNIAEHFKISHPTATYSCYLSVEEKKKVDKLLI